MTSLKNLGDKLAHIEQTLCSKPEKASRCKAKRKLKRMKYGIIDVKPCENQDPPIDEMKLDQPNQVVQVTTMNVVRCLAIK